MKKRLLSLFLAVVLMITIVPMQSFAVEEEFVNEQSEQIGEEGSPDAETDMSEVSSEEKSPDDSESQDVTEEGTNVLSTENDSEETESLGESGNDIQKDDSEKKTDEEQIENQIEEDGDPGAWRLSGGIPEGFMGPSVFSRANGYQHNDRFDGYEIKNGIDVSVWNGNIDWKKVKNAGIDFAIIRVAYRAYGSSGSLNLDECYKQNLKGAIDAGIPVGVYIFSQATTVKEAQEEADYILKYIDGYDITLPVVMDFEYANDADGKLTGRLYKANLSRSAATNVCMAFCNRVSAKGYTPMLYANASMLSDDLNASTISAKYPIWLAHYTYKTNYTGDYDFWQYTSTGKVSGITGNNGNVDKNFWYVKKESYPVENFKALGNSTSSVKLTWNAVNEADGYQIYRKVYGSSDYKRIATINDSKIDSYLDENLVSGTGYYYKIRTITDGEHGDFSKAVMGIAKIGTTTITDLQPLFAAVRLTWEKVDGATGYQVQYAPAGGTYETAATVSSGSTTTAVVSKLDSETEYKFRVRPIKEIGGYTSYSSYSESVSGNTAAFGYGQLTAAVNARSGPGMSYSSYKVLAPDTFLPLTKSEGGWYQTVITVDGEKETAYVSASYVDVLLSDPGTIEIGVPEVETVATSFDQIKVSWSKVEDASGYQVQRYTSGVYKTIKTIVGNSTLSCTDNWLIADTAYKYRVRAYKQINDNIYYGENVDSKVMTQKSRWGIITADNVSARSGAGTSYDNLKTLIAGMEIEVTGSNSNWYRTKVTVNGSRVKAYVQKQYIDLGGFDEAITVGRPTLSVKSASFDQIRLSWTKTEGASGYEIQRYGSGKYSTIKTITSGSTLTYTDRYLIASTTYKYRIRAFGIVDGKRVYGNYSSVDTAVTEKSRWGTITANDVRARSGAGTSYSILKTLKKGVEIEVTGSRGDWYRTKVTVDGTRVKAYVLKTYIDLP